jgi:hypothetical protein
MIRLYSSAVRNQRGFLVPVIMIFLLAFVSVGTATLVLVNSNSNISQGEKYRLHAQLAADAGSDASIQELNTNASWSGTAETTVMSNSSTRTTYSSTITDDAIDPLKKTLTVTGRAYSPATSTTARSERKYEIALRGVGGGSYAVVTGVGGLYMQNSSKIVGGDVYVNGVISLKNSAQIGLTTSPVSVKAAHQNCPVVPDATYPRACASGENGQPISLLNTAKIYGEVRATNQTDGAGMSNTGLVAGASVPPLPLPSHDREAQKTAVASTITAAAASCAGGTKTWAADLKITGDVTISNGCKVTVQGDVWITGSLELSNSSEMKVTNGLAEPPEIMIDSSEGLDVSNSSKLSSNTNATPVGFRILTYWSAAPCTPECADVTGVALADGRDDVTIELNNGSSGPNTEFYARWSAVELSNSGNVGAVVGQTVSLTNSATITFGTPVSGASSPSAWVVSSYRRLY